MLLHGFTDSPFPCLHCCLKLSVKIPRSIVSSTAQRSSERLGTDRPVPQLGLRAGSLCHFCAWHTNGKATNPLMPSSQDDGEQQHQKRVSGEHVPQQPGLCRGRPTVLSLFQLLLWVPVSLPY